MTPSIGNDVDLKGKAILSNSVSENKKQVLEKSGINAVATGPCDGTEVYDPSSDNSVLDTAEAVVTHLLPMRDDFEPALTFRSVFLASCLASFQAAMSQIYSVIAYPRVMQFNANIFPNFSSNLRRSEYQGHSLSSLPTSQGLLGPSFFREEMCMKPDGGRKVAKASRLAGSEYCHSLTTGIGTSRNMLFVPLPQRLLLMLPPVSPSSLPKTCSTIYRSRQQR